MYHTRVLLALELRVSSLMGRNRVVVPILQLLRLSFGFFGQFGEALFEAPLPTTQSAVRLYPHLFAAYPRVKRQPLRRLFFSVVDHSFHALSAYVDSQDNAHEKSVPHT